MYDGPRYDRSHSYSMHPGEKTKLTVHGCESMAEANKCLAYLLVESGYRYPEWKEWWRWFERRPTRDLSIRIDDELARINAKG